MHTNKRVEPSIIRYVLRISRSIKGRPKIAAGRPKTSRTLAILDPTTFPIAKPETPSRTALIEITNSGAEVPNATIVSPTINFGIPNLSATPTAPLISRSPDSSKKNKAKRVKIKK